MSTLCNGDGREQIGDEVKVKPACPYKEIDVNDPDKKCMLCNSTVKDNLNYGEMYEMEDVICHYFCLLFSSNLSQNGADHEGILGFLPADIKKEVRRGSRLRCSYCRKTGASIGCHLKSCKKAFHLPCGLKNGSMHQFYDCFLSFCVLHRPIQTVHPKYVKKADNDSRICVICYEDVLNQVSNDTLWAPCCKKQWFHRHCLHRQALAQGYFFKCPMCNDNIKFNQEMKKFGIYVPEMDAAWERVPQAFEDLLTPYSTCDAAKCDCPDGRNFSQKTGSWRLLRCNSCGSQGTHIRCSCLKFTAGSRSWCCQPCNDVIKRANQSRNVEVVEEIVNVSRSRGRKKTNSASATVSSSEASNSSLRRSAAIDSELQASKRRKKSPCTTHLDASSSSPSLPLSERSDQAAGPSEVESSDDSDGEDGDGIVVVDDTDGDDLEVMDEEEHRKSPSLEKTKYYNKELLTKDGQTVKVHEVSVGASEVLKEGAAVQIELSPARRNSLKCGSSSSKEIDLMTSPSTSSTHDSTLGIRIDNVRHSNELFSPSTTEESQRTSLPSASQFSPGQLPIFSFENQGQMCHIPSQQPIYYIHTRTKDGQRAIQPMMPLSSLNMSHQPHQIFQAQSPTVVTLE